MFIVETPAKINLSLEIIGKRQDSFHEIVSVMQAVTLTDQLSISLSSEVHLECNDDSLASPDNIVLQTVDLLRSRYNVAAGCTLGLQKRIPVAAGLGGGSSDAAAALVALNRLWSLNLSCAELMTLATQLGSDVPFFLFGNRALVEGRGEFVTPIPRGKTCWYVLVRPHVPVSTAMVFRSLSCQAWSDGTVTKALAYGSGVALEPGVNGLQSSLFSLCPEAHECFDHAEREAPGNTIVSGSGPTVVSIFTSQLLARRAQTRLAAYGYWTAICSDFTRKDWTTPCVAA